MASLSDIIESSLRSRGLHPERSTVVTSLLHPLDASRKAGAWLEDQARVASGQPGYDMPGPATPEQQAEAGLTLAGLMGTGAMPVARAGGPGTLGMFAGAKAKTADHAALKAAEELESAGKPMQEIWSQTGWFKAPWDDKWRFEIDDSAAMPTPRSEWSWGSDEGIRRKETAIGPVSEFLSHDPLHAAYDGVMDFGDADRRMLANIQPHQSTGGSYGEGIIRAGLDGDVVNRSVLLHELMHGIQDREGFARGGSPEMAFRDPRMWGGSSEGSDIARKMLDDKLRELSAPMPIEEYAKQAWGSDAVTPEIAADYAGYVKTAAKPLGQDVINAAQKTVARDWYKRLSGEAEARLVQDRMNLTPDQRREQYPLNSLAAMLNREGIDPGDNFSNLITRYEDGPAMSVPDYAKLNIGASEFRDAPMESLTAALERIRARNKAKGLDDDIATGAIRDEIARRNAVEMLGLPEGNTAADRARAMGFDTPAYHASDADISAFDNDRLGELTGNNTGGDRWAVALAKKGHWLADRDLSGRMYSNASYPSIIPSPSRDYASLDAAAKGRNLPAVARVADEEFGVNSYIVPDPKNIRSRFAAFDPARRDSANILAGLAGAAVLTPALADYLDNRGQDSE